MNPKIRRLSGLLVDGDDETGFLDCRVLPLCERSCPANHAQFPIQADHSLQSSAATSDYDQYHSFAHELSILCTDRVCSSDVFTIAR
jgi:hypothetical protein